MPPFFQLEILSDYIKIHHIHHVRERRFHTTQRIHYRASGYGFLLVQFKFFFDLAEQQAYLVQQLAVSNRPYIATLVALRNDCWLEVVAIEVRQSIDNDK